MDTAARQGDTVARTYRQIPTEILRGISVVATDIDGTLTGPDGVIRSAAARAVHDIEAHGIPVCLLSGRTIDTVEDVARRLQTTGFLVGEDGGVAKRRVGATLTDLGYSRRPALNALAILRATLGDRIQETEDNQCRLVDVAIRNEGIRVRQIRRLLDGVSVLDSGFMIHLVDVRVSKAATLLRLLSGNGSPTATPPQAVLVFGDSPTDLSLFHEFPHSVLVSNPVQDEAEARRLRKAAAYSTESSYGEGFAEVVRFLIEARRSP